MRRISEEQKVKLRAAQLAYIANDPRWAEHRQKLAQRQLDRKFTLYPEEIAKVREMRRRGRNFRYIAEELCISRCILRRELRAIGFDTSHQKKRTFIRGKGMWRCQDPLPAL